MQVTAIDSMDVQDEIAFVWSKTEQEQEQERRQEQVREQEKEREQERNNRRLLVLKGIYLFGAQMTRVFLKVSFFMNCIPRVITFWITLVRIVFVISFCQPYHDYFNLVVF